MRAKMLIAILVAFLATSFGSTKQANAIGGWYDRDWRRVPRAERSHRAVEHWLHPPRTRYRYRLHTAEDPYAYRYERRGYYPYYGAGYWRPRHTQVGRYRDGVEKPPYYPAWGYGARRCWQPVRRVDHRQADRRRAYVRVRCQRR